MHINTTARHLELDPEVRLYAHERIEKLTRYGRDIREAHLVVTAEGYRHHAEITLHLKGQHMVSREEATEPRAAIERAVGHLENQLRKLKERRLDRKRGSRAADAKGAAAESAAAGFAANGDGADEDWDGEA
jgi:putative sigma-54 modulation protein